MKALWSVLLGLLTAGGVIFLFFDVKLEPKMNNIIIFGSNNNVNPSIDSRSATPVPQPSVQAQATPLPAEPPKETSSVKQNPAKENNTAEADGTITPADQSSIPYTKTTAAKAKNNPKYRAVSDDSSDYYPNNYDGNNQDGDDSDENDWSCPENRKTNKYSVQNPDANDIDDRVFQQSRPTTYQSSRSEQRQETIINGVRTVRRTVTVTNNGQTKTYVYDY